MKKKHIIIIVLGILFTLTLVFTFNKVNSNNLSADSGFDSSWDYDSSSFDWGGSSDWGSSDWSSSDWSSDRDYSSNHRYNTYSTSNISDDNYLSIVIFFLSIVLISFLIRGIRSIKDVDTQNIVSTDYTNIHQYKENKNIVSSIEGEIPGFNKKEFYDYIYKNFVDLQTAWMNFDYETIRKLVTDELYNTYKSQLKTLELKKQKNIMRNFSKDSAYIIDYYRTNDKHIIKVKLTARFYDYLVNSNNKVIRGKDKRRIIITYLLTYESSAIKKDNKCPNCNAPLDNEAQSNICPYCRSTIINDYHDFLLSKKENINQKME